MGRRTLTLLTVGFLLAADSPVKEVQQEMKKFQGTWAVARARRDGEVDAELAGATVTLAGNMFTSKSGKAILAQGTWKVDPAKKPKTIDIEYTDGPEKGQTAYGIYSLTDGAWIVLISSPGKDRPVSFETESENGCTFLV